ncbi:MAG: UDP binding domain-containing protein [Dehalococcoidia bacterium]
MRPGLGFGGGCLPKDLDALVARGDDVRAAMSVCRAVRDVNQAQRARLVETLTAALGDLAGRRIALVGLTFKPHTNDLRDAPAVEIAGRLARAGAQVRGWDPAFAGQDMSAVLDFDVAPDLYDALTGVHAAVLCTGGLKRWRLTIGARRRSWPAARCSMGATAGTLSLPAATACAWSASVGRPCQSGSGRWRPCGERCSRTVAGAANLCSILMLAPRRLCHADRSAARAPARPPNRVCKGSTTRAPMSLAPPCSDAA